MKRLQFEYYMKIDYSQPVSACYFTLKCFPAHDDRQRVLLCETELYPQTTFSKGSDSFGNFLIYGKAEGMHDMFSVRVTGEIGLARTDHETLMKDNEIYIFRNPYGMNRPGSRIRAYYDSLQPSLPEDDLERAIYLMERIHRDIIYEKGCTDINTSAETAFSQGRGVCQDFSHIFISLCHLSGIPARYVTGLLVGEGESHAWVEISYKGKWIGLDVTNVSQVTDSHVKFGHGRDAGDCRLNTGLIYGSASQIQSVRALAELVEQ